MRTEGWHSRGSEVDFFALLLVTLVAGCGNGDSAAGSTTIGGASASIRPGGASGAGRTNAIAVGGHSVVDTGVVVGGTASSSAGSTFGGTSAQQTSLWSGGVTAASGGNGGTSAAMSSSGASGTLTGGTSSGGTLTGGTPPTTVAAGGITATTGGTPHTGGIAAFGGTAAGGTVSATGAKPSTSTGIPQGDGGPSTVVNMTLELAASDMATTLALVLPAGAAPVPLANLTLTGCGRLGGGTTLNADDIVFNQATLLCPNGETADCSWGSNYQLVPSRSVSAPGMSGCYTFDLSTSTRTLYVGGSIRLVFRLDQEPTGAILNRQFQEIWSILVDGETAGHCTIPPLPSTKAVCSE